jgi:hypothetical protein
MPDFSGFVDPLEKKVHDALSTESLMAHTRAIARWERESGSEGERKAFDYIEKQVRSLRLAVDREEVEAFLSLPESASAEVVTPRPASFRALTPSFSAPTSGRGLDGTLLYLGEGTEADFAGRDVSGKILLLDGLASPVAARRAETAGVAGLVFAGDDHLHNMIVTTLWGAPGLSQKDRIPGIPCVSIVKQDGLSLKERLKKGPVRVRLRTKVRTGWMKIPLLTAEIAGEEEGRFLLLSGHVDSWHLGAQDNAGANAAMIEICRLVRSLPKPLKRGIRVAFWSGHSHGRYAGSTWYADHHWEELHRAAAVHLNVDCIGAKGATVYSNLFATEDGWDVAESVIRDCAGQRVKARRCPRAGDQSFWGIGLPSLFMDLSGVPSEKSAATAGFIGTGGLPWWWHTADDTVDKMDPGVLALDTRIYLSSVLRYCNSPVLPLNEEIHAREILRALRGHQEASQGLVDLSGAIGAARALAALAGRLNRAIDAGLRSRPKAAWRETANACLMGLSRHLVRLNYTEANPFEHDPAVPLPPAPDLRAAARLPGLDSKEDRKFLEIELVRRQNKVLHALTWARETILASGLV